MTARKKGSFWTFADRFEGDKVVWIIVLLLFLISIVCMFSSSSRLLSGSTTRLDMVKEQLMVVVAGLAVVIVLYNIKSIKFFRICSSLGFGISLLLLLLLDLRVRMGSFLVAKEINGAYRVLSIEGIQIHVFEIVKVAMVMYLAWAIDMFKHKRLPGKGLSEIWQKIIYIYLPFLIVFVMILVGSNSSAIIVGG